MSSDRISVTVRMPGKFDFFFSGTGIAQGQYDKNDPIEVLAYHAWDNSGHRTTSGGYYRVLHLEGARGIVKATLALFADYADTCVAANSQRGAQNRAEKVAAQTFIKNLETVIEKIERKLADD